MQAAHDDPGAESPPPPSSSFSLQAAAALNAADVVSRRSSTGSPQALRAARQRRSVVALNLNHNDPTLPSPGELSCSDRRSSTRGSFTYSPPSIGGTPAIATGDPHHQRECSLGQIHQELEQEQEAQVNRLLNMIRSQQEQLDQIKQQTPGSAIDDTTPPSERSSSLPSFPPLPLPASNLDRPLATHTRDSTGEIGAASPEWIALGGDGAGRRSSIDDVAYYQAETASLTRENQMLRLRIKELERHIGQLSASSPHEPVEHSNLTSSITGSLLDSPSESKLELPPAAQDSGLKDGE